MRVINNRFSVSEPAKVSYAISVGEVACSAGWQVPA